MIVCPHCSRPNPPHARFCHHDGKPLPAVIAPTATWTPLVRELRPAKEDERRCASSPMDCPLPPVVRTHRRSPLRLGAMLAVALLLTGLAGVGVALSLPGKSSLSPTITIASAEPPAPPPSPPSPPAEEEPVPRSSSDAQPRLAVSARRPAPPRLALAEIQTAEVEVVFCIDTTGSMGGLIRAAQQKIWSLCNQIAAGKPTPTLRIGLVAFRDRGDEYVTRILPLTRDLDSVHQELLLLKPSGGGDTPESVNQALDDAVNRIEWSTEKKTLRIVFLIGDAPPHMDYSDDVKYSSTCERARDKGIFINAIQCGHNADCTRHWKQIASASGGEYVAIAQSGGVREILTPHDDRLTKLVGELLDSALIFGTAEQKRAGERIVQAARSLRGPVAADRAAFVARSKRLGPNDLVEAIASQRLRLEDVKETDLPASFQRMTLKQRKEHLATVTAQRAQLQAEALEVEKKRAEYLKSRTKGDGFDSKVLDVLRKQAKKCEIVY